MNTKTTPRKATHALAGAVALAITLAAGSSYALETNPNHYSAEHSGKVHDATPWLTLVRSDTLMGTKVVGSDNEKIGNIDDLVIDRGTGRIVFAVVGHGGILSIGEDLFATEYSRMTYYPTLERFEINMTKEQADRQVEFLPENWKDLGHSDWMDEFNEFMSDEDTKLYGGVNLANGKTHEVEGTITDVKRLENGDTEDVIVTVETKDGDSREVILGPSWYIMGLDSAPTVSDTIELVAAKHDGRMIAIEAKIAGRDIKLRDSDGKVQWKMDSRETPRYVLLSDLIGRDVEIGGTTSGEIQSAVVETSSGRVAFFGFDPNENLFGLADEISLVPWSEFNITPDLTIWSNSDDETFSGALAMPEDLGTMKTKRSLQNAYSPFSEDVPNFEVQKYEDRSDTSSKTWDRTGEAWNKNSKLTTMFADGKKVKLKGDFIRTDTVELHNGAITATTILLNTDDGEQQVILGPTWYIENQEMDIDWGDEVRVVGRKTTIDGKTYIAAWNLEDPKTSWTLWNDTTPAWVD
ncbi:MAG: PRC-barrel domain-containing protein [Phycisphaerales bacterium]|nr:PRC-barrel domain-containing protein [Phycisphaerales bacterium]